ncbi:MAG: TolC family protein [Betaproteobacteria bacterium]|nr:TolC family protein [Betaproteobacteria bacterium]
MTAPAPHQRWVAEEPLPPVAAPVLPLPLTGEFAGPLSLAQLTDLALRINPRARQAWAQARADAAGLGVEKADELPQVSALVNFNRNQGVAAQSGTAIPLQNRYGPTISLSYILFDFGARAAEVEAARYRLLASNLLQNRVLQEVAVQVEQAYYRYLGLQQLVTASREALKNFETGLDAAQKRRESGLATIGDVYRAETAVGQARLTLQRNEGELAKSRGLLNNAVGLPVDYPLTLQPLPGRVPVTEITRSVDALLRQAKANRPDLVAAEARARAARATVNAVTAAGRPSLEFAPSYGRTFFTDSRSEVETYGFVFNLRIPLFTGFRDTYNVRRAQAQAELAESVRDQLYGQAETDVWQAYFDVQTATTGIASSESLVRSATQSAAAAVARYRAGVGSLLDMITAQVDETNARVQAIQSQLDWYTALARLGFALGAPDSSVISRKTP